MNRAGNICMGGGITRFNRKYNRDQRGVTGVGTLLSNTNESDQQ